MVASVGAEMSSSAPLHSHDVNVIYSPVPHSNASTPPHMMSSCEYHPAYGPIPISGTECTYYAPHGHHESYQYIGPGDSGGYHPQMCSVNTEYGKTSLQTYNYTTT